MGLFKLIFGDSNQLTYERNKAILAGPSEDISRIQKLDKEIGKLTAAYNGVARVPPAVTQKIDAMVEQVRPSFARVVARKPYEENQLESAATWLRGEKPVTAVPVNRLEYVVTYPASYGKPVEQRLALVMVKPSL